MAKVKYIPCDVYKRGVSVFVGTYEELVKWSKEEFTNPDYEDFLKTLEENSPKGEADCHYDCGSCVVRIEQFPCTPGEVAALAHELLHGVFYILGYCGVEYAYNTSNEAYTYLLEWLMGEALRMEGYKDVE